MSAALSQRAITAAWEHSTSAGGSSADAALSSLRANNLSRNPMFHLAAPRGRGVLAYPSVFGAPTYPCEALLSSSRPANVGPLRTSRDGLLGALLGGAVIGVSSGRSARPDRLRLWCFRPARWKAKAIDATNRSAGCDMLKSGNSFVRRHGHPAPGTPRSDGRTFAKVPRKGGHHP